MARLIKNHRRNGWKCVVNGSVDGDGEPHLLAQMLGDNDDKYHGQWHHGVYQGSGVCGWASGEQYTGDWMQDNVNGMGVRRWPSGNRYEGEWKDDKGHGMAVYFYANGDIFQGEFRNGKRVYGVWTYANGDKELRKFNDADNEVVHKTIKGLVLAMCDSCRPCTNSLTIHN